MSLIDDILKSRGMSAKDIEAFLSPDYNSLRNPFDLPDMEKAVQRLLVAKENRDKITVYGDYDIDGLTASTVLYEGLKSFGYENIDVFIPNRFTEGYGLNEEAIERIANTGSKLIITVDCGSLSHKEISKANGLGVDVIVTDHHNVADIQPPAIAVINPKRKDSQYGFNDLAGVGVAFNLVRAMQTAIDGLPEGQEKWLLDLVALGTVCDVVNLLDENRTYVYWGLKVMQMQRRKGLSELMKVSKVDVKTISSRSLGFAMGPRMNAAGRLETARLALDMLLSDSRSEAKVLAESLDELNTKRRKEQQDILDQAINQANSYLDDRVLVVSASNWSHGIIGIVAAKLLEKYKKPVYIFQELGELSKGSARSFGDFSAADGIKYSGDIVIKGGGHKYAAGLTIATKDIGKFRKKVNEYYQKQNYIDQEDLLLPKADSVIKLSNANIETYNSILGLEPFGNGNPQPIFCSHNLSVVDVRRMGDRSQHLKIRLQDDSGSSMDFLAFSAPEEFIVEIGVIVSVWYYLETNEWRNNITMQGKIINIKPI